MDPYLTFKTKTGFGSETLGERGTFPYTLRTTSFSFLRTIRGNFVPSPDSQTFFWIIVSVLLSAMCRTFVVHSVAGDRKNWCEATRVSLVLMEGGGGMIPSSLFQKYFHSQN